MRYILAPIVSFALVACAGYSDPEPPAVPSDAVAADGGECDADPVQYHVGHDATEEMGATILKESGARTLRWGAPNTVWTMDYRIDRVNVRYDEDMKITDVTCG